MATQTNGKVYAVDHNRRQIAVRIFGLTPKVIRFHTDDMDWQYGEDVVITVRRPTEEDTNDLVLVEGYEID